MPKHDNAKLDLPFAKAYNFLLADTKLTASEKMVMIIVCRYWPNPYWDTNAQIAKEIGFTERYIEKIIKRLANKRYIKRGFAHTTRNYRPHTVRVIVPRCFGFNPPKKIKWIQPEQMDGQQTERVDGQFPNKRTQSPEHTDDLLERKREKEANLNRKATPAPLPARGQASALLEDREMEQKTNIEQFKQKFGIGAKREQRKHPSPAEFEKKKQQQIKALLKKKLKKDEFYA